MIGRKISHFHVIEKLGGGGMGVVYKAQDERLPRWVALKFLPPYLADSEQDRVRLEREASAASALDHPNICTIHEIDETEDGQLFIAMAFYEGETLKKKIEADTLSLDESTRIALQAAEGLAAAHRLGIIHRDIKPANLMITDDGTVKIVDFGLAKREGQTKITRTNTVLGTPIYMSPEQLRGDEADRRSDVWSLGVVLFQMLSGELPFTTDYDQAAIYSILNTDPESISDHVDNVPDQLQRILAKALSRDPDERYQDAGEMTLALKKMREELGLATASTVATKTWRPEPEPRPRPWWKDTRVTITSAILLFALILGIWLTTTFWNGSSSASSDNPEVQKLFEQAKNYEKQGYTPAKMKNSEQLYRRALELEPENATVQAHLASLLARMQRQYPSAERAEEILHLADSAIAQNSDLARAWLARGTVLKLQGDLEDAESSARKAIELDPVDFRGFVLLGETLIASGRVEEGLTTLRLGTEVGDGYIRGRESLGYHLMLQGQYDEAAEEFEKVLQYAPDSPSALNNLAVIYLYHGRYADAVPRLNHLLRLEPEDDLVWGNLGSAYQSLDRLPEAREAYSRANALAPEEPSYLISLGEIHEKEADEQESRIYYEKALAAANHALEAGGRREDALGQRALCAGKLGRFDESKAAVEEALDLAPTENQILYRAAQVYAMAGDDERTYEYTQQALAAGHSRDWFHSDLSFRGYREDSRFRAILEGPVEP